MRILIDTNILIGLEDNKIIEKSFANFYRLAIQNSCNLLYHPKAIPLDISRDKNQERKEIINSKLLKYEILEDFAKPSKDFISNLKNSKINDEIDNKQIYQVYKNYVDLFVTQDMGIHKNAKKIGLSKKVLTIKQALEHLESLFTFQIPHHPILEEHSIRKIENKFNDTFFDSLRADYGEEQFNNWLKKCARKNRKCYTLIVDDKIEAILIYNIENIEDHQLPDIYNTALKICTLKVNSTTFGLKLGELFLKKMFELAINRKINTLYLTVYEKQEQLINLLKKFGFYKSKFKNSQGLIELRMIKNLNPDEINIEKNSILTHPFYSDRKEYKKYAVPIQPNFYIKLFKDGTLRQPGLFDQTFDSINEIEGNTIIKAYVCNSQIKRLKEGDILLFYCSKTSQVIEPVGILETASIICNFDDLLEIVKKKTVFPREELLKLFSKKQEVHVITFRLITYLKKQIGLKKIKNIASFKNKIQTITELKESDYIILKNEGYFDERYIIN